jgi:aminoglycoside phosphotransferase
MADDTMPALPVEAAGYMRGCNEKLTDGQPLYTAAQMHAYASQAVAAVAEDAGRYRWLRANKYAVGPHVIQFGQTDAYTVLHGDALDAAIDAARKQEDDRAE